MNQPMKWLGGLVVASCLVTAPPARADDDAPPPPTDKPAAAERETRGDGPTWRMTADSRPGERLREGMREGPREGGPPMGRVLTDEQFDEVIAILTDINPQRAEELKKIRKDSPERAGEILRENMGRLMELAFLKRRAPELYKLRVEDYKLNREAEGLAREYRAAADKKDDATAKAKLDQLVAKLGEQFAVRQKMREQEVARLEKQVAELKAKIDATAKAKDELIKGRVDDLTNREAKPEW